MDEDIDIGITNTFSVQSLIDYTTQLEAMNIVADIENLVREENFAEAAIRNEELLSFIRQHIDQYNIYNIQDYRPRGE